MTARRSVLRGIVGIAGAALAGCAVRPRGESKARVVVIGAGFGGATAAKYVRLFSDHTIGVSLIEPNPRFVSAPSSNLVIGGHLDLEDITSSYDGLRRHGIAIVPDRAVRIDPSKKRVTLSHGARLRYDKLLLAPGIDLMFESIAGLAEARTAGRIVQAWSAGVETLALRRQLTTMRDGGVFAITIPETPYRCPPAPYERASLVADYFKTYKPRAKVLVLDANQDVTAMAALFKQAWKDLYGDRLEYRNHHKAVAVDAGSLRVRFEVQDDIEADVLNVLPPVRAGAIATQTGLANVNGRWCEVDFRDFGSTLARDIHVLGDSIQAAPMMPKSGHMANGHAKVAAAAIVAQLSGQEPDPQPMLTNACYSFVSASEVIHSVAVYAYSATNKTFTPVAGAGGISPARSALEAGFATAWAHDAWADMLA